MGDDATGATSSPEHRGREATVPRRTRPALLIVTIGELLVAIAVLVAAFAPGEHGALPVGEALGSLAFAMVGALVLLVPAAAVAWIGPRWLVAIATPVLLVIATWIGLVFAFIVHSSRAEDPWHDA